MSQREQLKRVTLTAACIVQRILHIRRDEGGTYDTNTTSNISHHQLQGKGLQITLSPTHKLSPCFWIDQWEDIPANHKTLKVLMGKLSQPKMVQILQTKFTFSPSLLFQQLSKHLPLISFIVKCQRSIFHCCEHCSSLLNLSKQSSFNIIS